MEEVRLIKPKATHPPVREPVSFLKSSRATLANIRLPKAKALIIIGVSILAVLGIVKIISVMLKSRPKPQDSSVFVVDKVNKKPVPLNKLNKSKSVVLVAPINAANKGKAIRTPGVRLGLRPKEDCLVEVRVDGHIVLRGVLKKNRFESWTAKERIDFFLANAGVVGVEVNGSAPTLLGRRGEVLRNISLTKDEGLTIKR